MTLTRHELLDELVLSLPVMETSDGEVLDTFMDMDDRTWRVIRLSQFPKRFARVRRHQYTPAPCPEHQVSRIFGVAPRRPAPVQPHSIGLQCFTHSLLVPTYRDTIVWNHGNRRVDLVIT